MILLIDNYDSFTESVSVLLRTGAEVLVRRNDALTLEEIAALAPEKIVISRAPARRMRRDFPRGYPPLCRKNAAAGRLSRAPGDRPCVWRDYRAGGPVMHGKTSLIEHNGEGVFQGLNNPLTVTRYHSLVIDPPTLPSEFNVTARSASGEIMGIRHREWDLEGVQFHPESILSEQGHQLLANFLKR